MQGAGEQGFQVLNKELVECFWVGWIGFEEGKSSLDRTSTKELEVPRSEVNVWIFLVVCGNNSACTHNPNACYFQSSLMPPNACFGMNI